jgi:hypothetical protein
MWLRSRKRYEQRLANMTPAELNAAIAAWEARAARMIRTSNWALAIGSLYLLGLAFALLWHLYGPLLTR